MVSARILWAPIYVEDNYGIPLQGIKIMVFANDTNTWVGNAYTQRDGRESFVACRNFQDYNS